ncbi:MAG: hypothetical protein R3D45_03320 [Rhizobiaceae bacterium]
MHVAKRLLLDVVGYVSSLVGFFLALALLFAVAAKIHPEIGAWTVAGVSPVLAFTAPLAALFVVLTAAVLSAVPMAIAALLTEWFALRAPWFYAIPAAALAGGVYLHLSPRTVFGFDAVVLTETIVFAAAGAISGLVYWVIAGRKAGFRLAVDTA